MRAVAITQELPLCSCVQPRQMRVERGKEERNRRRGMSSSRMIKCVLIKRGMNGQTDLRTQPCSVRDIGPNGTSGPFKVSKYIFHLMQVYITFQAPVKDQYCTSMFLKILRYTSRSWTRCISLLLFSSSFPETRYQGDLDKNVCVITGNGRALHHVYKGAWYCRS